MSPCVCVRTFAAATTAACLINGLKISRRPMAADLQALHSASTSLIARRGNQEEMPVKPQDTGTLSQSASLVALIMSPLTSSISSSPPIMQRVTYTNKHPHTQQQHQQQDNTTQTHAYLLRRTHTHTHTHVSPSQATSTTNEGMQWKPQTTQHTQPSKEEPQKKFNKEKASPHEASACSRDHGARMQHERANISLVYQRTSIFEQLSLSCLDGRTKDRAVVSVCG